MMFLTFLGRGWQRSQARAAKGSTPSTTKRRARRILPSSVVSLSRSPAPAVGLPEAGKERGAGFAGAGAGRQPGGSERRPGT